MHKGPYAVAACCALAIGFAAGAADAQRSKDTMRSAFNSPIRGISYYYDPKPDTVMEQAAVYDGLVVFDEKAGKMEPLLAKAWRRIGDKTIEFDLRDDVKWHDGEKFDADDVVYTYRWLIDPKVKLRFKRFWSWIAGIEKLGPYKVRITAKRPTPYDIMRHAYLTAMLPEHIHSKLKEKVEFGQHPVGTGMFKAIQVDKNAGIILERNEAFRHGGKGKPVTNIKRMTFASMPDYGTQLAQFLAGNGARLDAGSGGECRTRAGGGAHHRPVDLLHLCRARREGPRRARRADGPPRSPGAVQGDRP
jgi:peptide/nickel transport system substrate-binding protein